MRKLIVAHRGASVEAHGNTLEAFQRAIDLGADMIELDVYKTKDGELAVFHDPVINFHRVKNLTYAELNGLTKDKGFTVPTLSESLELIRGNAKVQIELKGINFGVEAAAEALSILKPEDFYIISFFFRPLRVVKRSYPQVKTLLIMGGLVENLWPLRWYFLNRQQALDCLDGVAISWRLWRKNWGKKFPKSKDVFVWVVDDMELFKQICGDERITGITTNNPRLAVTTLNYANSQ